MRGGWRPTRALGRAALLGLLLVVAGGILGRADVTLVGVPLLACALWALVTRPTVAPTVTSRVEPDVAHEGEDVLWRVDVAPVPGLRDVAAHLPADHWADTTPSHGHVAAAATPGELTSVAVSARMTRWGSRRLGPAQLAAFSDLGSFVWPWPVQQEHRVPTVPRPGTFTAGTGLPHPVGLVGQHRGARPGSGAELADIRPFRTGDRLRRIHWPVSMRTGTLHVTTSYADQDAEVLLVVDAIRDLGRRTERTPSSVDTAVEAAGALAAHYLGTGDRVGLSVLGGRGLVEVPAVGGHHQLARALRALAGVEPGRGTVGEERMLAAQLRRTPRPGAVVVVLSALIAPQPLAHAVQLARSGHLVIVIDTLPEGLHGGRPDHDAVVDATGLDDARTADLVWRLRLLQRAREVRRCEQAGVPVIRWQGPGTLDAVLRGVGRRARAPRVVAR